MEMELTKYEKRLLKSRWGIQRSVTLCMAIFIFSTLVLLAQILGWEAFEGSSMTVPVIMLFVSAFFHSYYTLQVRHLKRLQSLEGSSRLG